MKTLWILFVTALVKCDKLDKRYLPPIGANYSGGSFENTVPFQVPEERYTGNKYYPENVPISRIEPEASVGGRGSSINIPTGLPSTTTTKSVSIFPFSDTRNYDEGLLNEPYNNYDSSQDKPSKNTDPSKSSVQNQFKDNILADGTPSSLITNPTGADYKERNPINIAKNGIPQTTNFKYPERITRPQAEADRNAVILNYDNVITPEGFAYSYDTSNGIHADENGTAIDGVKADGSYSYIDDDGKLYNVTYSADENGFRPRGDHLPTSPPIPEAILKVIEQAAIDKSKGIFDDGTYDENKYGYRKYQTPSERFFSNNKPTSTRKYNSDIIKQNEINNLNIEKDENFNARDKDFPTELASNSPFYTSNGNTINNSRRPLIKDSKDVNDVFKSQLVNLNQEPIEDFRQGTNEPNNAMDRQSYEIQESTKTSLPTGPLPQIESGYKYPSPKDRFESSQLNNNKGYSNYGDSKIILSPDIGQSISNKNKDFDGVNQNNIPFIEDETLNQQNNNVNTFTEPEQGYSNGNRDYKFGQRIPSEASTRTPYDYYSTITTSRPFSITSTNEPDEHSASDIQFPTKGNLNPLPILSTSYPLNDQTVKQYDTYTVQPNQFYNASPSERIKQFDTYTGRPTNYYGPSSTERINQLDTYTGQPNAFNGPSSTERVNQLDTGLPTNYYIPSSTDRKNQLGTGRPTNFYGPSSTERINQLDTYTGRPKAFNGSSSTDRIKQLNRYTGRPTNAYGPSSTERINQFDTYTGRPNDFSGPSSSDRIKQLDRYTGRPTNVYGPSSTERINQLDTYTGRPNDFNGPSSTDRIKQLDRYTGRPTNVYGPSSTERINQLDTYTGRPNDFNGPSSTDRIKQLDRYTGRPTNAYGPSSTERINQLDTYTGQPNAFNGPSSTERVNQLNTGLPTNYYIPSSTDRKNQLGTGRPTNFYGPSSTERINQLDTYTGRPKAFNGPSSTDRIKQLNRYTGRPTNVYGPSSTEIINQLDTYTGRPNDFNGPSSTDRIKQLDRYTGRPTNVYGPSSAERINQLDTYTGRPNDFNGPSSTDRIKQLDRYTGRPTNVYGPSSAERIKYQLDTYTGRPNDFNGPSLTDRIKQLDRYTGRPTNVYGPSSAERINQLDTYTGRPNDFNGPSSTDRIKQLDRYTGRPTNTYGPTSTERINAVYGSSSTNERGSINTNDDQPNNFYGPTSTEKIKPFDASSPQISVGDSSPAAKIIGEDFVGPKQPQSYDPETGYHY